MSGYLSFTGQTGCYAELPLDVLAGATDFTIEIKLATASTKSTSNPWSWGTIAGREISSFGKDDWAICVNGGELRFWCSPASKGTAATNLQVLTPTTIVNDGAIHKVAVVSSGGAVYLYCDGSLVASANNVNAKITNKQTILLAFNSDARTYLQMDLYEARFWNVARTQEQIFTDIDGTETGLQAWYLPSEDGLLDYSGNGRHATLYGNHAYKVNVNQSFDVAIRDVIGVSFTADVARIVQKIWRYTNPGTADDLITSGTTLTNLPATKSKTGTAFYQTTRAKCFDLPATQEIWLKFDVYFDGSNRWRAFNGGDNSVAYNAGVTAQTSGYLSFVNLSAVQTGFAGICKANQLQTVLLHMQAGTTDGFVEAWVDGDFIHRYTGNVNNGEDFADIYLQSDGTGTFFSNVIISDGKVGLNDGFQIFSLDVARRVSNVITLDLDVARYVLKPVTVPLIGEHFNHLLREITITGGAQPIILPKSGRVYLRGKSQGIVRVYSDTDSQGMKAGYSFFTSGDLYDDIYAAVYARETVFVEVTDGDTPLQVIHALVHYLKEDGYGTRLDAAINYATKGKFATADALINQFLADLDNSANHNAFLLEKCGIRVYNKDTGAITGSDAGGLVPKTAESIVPEPLPVEKWTVPAPTDLEGWLADDYGFLFDSVDIRGITFQFPTNGANGTGLTAQEKFIIAGLVNVWLEQALILVEKSLGVACGGVASEDPNYLDADFVKYVVVQFKNSTDSTLASVSSNYWGGNADAFVLNINMRYFSNIDMTSEDGKLKNDYPRLDRVLAHEFTHIFMRSNMRNDNTAGYVALPLWLKEGIAELVHGVDDERRSTIIWLLNDDKGRGFLEKALAGDNDAYAYAAGFMLLRYMAKQGQNPVNDFAKSTVPTVDLLISDGDTDYFYNALTDNMRQLFGADVARTLIKSLGLIVDVVIRDFIPVAFNLDVARALSAELILFPIDDPPPVVNRLMAKAPLLKADAPAKKNTQGIQSFEVAIAEQQVTEQVNFIGVIPFDIMQKVKGQYLDYHYDMRVERVQQEGMIYRCECCSDLDQLLYTQLAYKIPPSTWRIAGEDDKTVEVQTHYPPAGAHIQKIAAALGLSVVTRFDNFLSTVLMDDLGGLTYSDLIRDVFGWSSRIPHQLINVYIRNGVLYVIQRGHESRTIDITNEKCTRPVITKELVRTTWGSTPWSKTQTFETTQNFWQASIPDDVTISGGDATTPSTPSTPDLPDVTIPGGDTQGDKVREVSTKFSGSDSEGYTTYTYGKNGLLIQTYTYVRKKSTSQNTYTTVNHYYDDDGTMIGTETFVQSTGGEGDSSSKSVEEKFYITLPNGEKFLASEYSASYQAEGSTTSFSSSDLVDSKVTVHSPSRVGQTHTITINSDGEIVGAAAGQDTGDNRVTPYSQHKTALLGKQLFASTSSGSSSGGTSGGTSSIPSGGSSGEWVTETKTKELTTNGVALYDSSFPIHDEAKLIQVTNALKWLNRKTRETLNISVYEFPHLIDFDDRVIFDGKEYFLVSNTATTTRRVFNEQNLTLVRWY